MPITGPSTQYLPQLSVSCKNDCFLSLLEVLRRGRDLLNFISFLRLLSMCLWHSFLPGNSILSVNKYYVRVMCSAAKWVPDPGCFPSCSDQKFALRSHYLTSVKLELRPSMSVIAKVPTTSPILCRKPMEHPWPAVPQMLKYPLPNQYSLI